MNSLNSILHKNGNNTGTVTIVKEEPRVFGYNHSRGFDVYSTQDFPYPVSKTSTVPVYSVIFDATDGEYEVQTKAFTTNRLGAQIKRLIKEAEGQRVAIYRKAIPKSTSGIYNVHAYGLPSFSRLDEVAEQLCFTRPYSELVLHLLDLNNLTPFQDKQDRYYAIKYYVNRKLRSSLENLL